MDRDSNGSITLLYARQITIDPDLPLPELMERYASQFRILIDEYGPDLVAARQVWDINGVDAAVSQVAPFGIAAYVCNERDIRFCHYTPQALKQPTRFNLAKGVNPLSAVDGTFGSHPPYWDDIQKTSLLVAWRAPLDH
ncbi:crossover junction endodeoxyribonuclease RuvC [Bradyrhizobium betae]|nr:crossover junction endodeoxyribonuclease RuvC [Bradyrhizobium betae]